jgi:preprotein translocase subunit SecF
LRIKDISEEKHQEILSKLKETHELEEMRFESIGPVIGEELKQKTILIIILSLLAIVAYVTFAFRKTQSSIKPWQYGIATLLALGHDVLIPIGVFALLGRYYGIEISIPVVVALLTVLGYSVNNTVVVFDRVRENLIRIRSNSLEEVVNKSLNDTLSRSINTSLTTLFVLLAIFFFGGATLQYFALALIIGIVAGTYSSIFLASPILLAWLNYKRSRE